MAPLEQAKTAAFWKLALCLDCGRESQATELVTECPACGGWLIDAALILECADFLEGEEE